MAAAVLALALALAPVASAEPASADAAALADVDRELDDIEELLFDAQFHTALGLTGATRDLLDGIPSVPGRADREARLEVLSATAEVALGRRGPARDSLVRALRADPALVLHESTTSPRVVELWREARRTVGISRRPEATR